MKVQIYTLQTPEEALAVAEAGVAHIGVTPADRGLPGEVSREMTRAIFAALPPGVVKVALSVEADLDDIVSMVHECGPDVLHLCALPGLVPPEAVRALRPRLPGVQIMQAVSVGGPETARAALETAQAYAPHVDYLILDSSTPTIAGVGASGETHDWSISRRIVQDVRVPVILAGGLSPENVGEAIRAVRPWGVDSLTHTNEKLAEGGFRKDIARVRAFVEAARAASVTSDGVNQPFRTPDSAPDQGDTP